MSGGTEVGRISIRVTPDTDNFRRDLLNDLQRIEKSVRATIGVDADTTGFREKVRAVTSNLPDAKVRVKADVDRSTLALLDGAGNSFGGGSGGFGRMGQFADTLAVVAAVAALAAPALALASGALVSLPAAAAAALTPIGAVALGIDGIKNAASQLSPDLDRLKAKMSSTFEDRLTPTFRQLRSLFPTLERSLSNVAHGISDVAQSLTDTITSSRGMDKIESTINNIGEAVSSSAPGFGSLTSGLLSLADRVSAKFPRLSDTVNGWFDSFDRWVDRVSTAGPDGIAPLDRAMTSFGDTMGELLGLVKDLASSGFEFLSDPEFGKSMKDFVADTRTLVRDLLPGLKTLFEQGAGFFGVIVDGLDKLDKWEPPKWLNLDPERARQQGQGLGAFPGMAKPDEPFWDVNETAFNFKAWFEDNIGKGVKIAKEQLSNMFDGIGSGLELFKSQVNTLWTGITSGVNIARTQLSSMWSGLQSGWQAAQIAYNSAINSIKTRASDVVGAVSSAWSSIPGTAARVWSQVVSAVSTSMAQVVQAVVNGGAQVLAQVASWPGKIAGALANMASIGANAGRQLVQGFINGISGMIGGAVAKARELAASVKNAVTGFLGIKSPSRVFEEIGRFTAEGMANGIGEGTGSVVEQAKQLAERVKQAMEEGMSGFEASGMAEQLDNALDVLELERKRLKVEYNSIPESDKTGREALRNRRDELRNTKDLLGYQEELLDQSEKYGSSLNSNSGSISSWGDLLDKYLDEQASFVDANASQLVRDLGGTGDGMLQSLISQGIGIGEQMIFNVASVDEAFQARDTHKKLKTLEQLGR